LCFQITFWQRAWRMPSIMEAWFSSSERITAFGRREPSVDSAAQFDT
jgi:hypothetical protein